MWKETIIATATRDGEPAEIDGPGLPIGCNFFTGENGQPDGVYEISVVTATGKTGSTGPVEILHNECGKPLKTVVVTIKIPEP